MTSTFSLLRISCQWMGRFVGKPTPKSVTFRANYMRIRKYTMVRCTHSCARKGVVEIHETVFSSIVLKIQSSCFVQLCLYSRTVLFHRIKDSKFTLCLVMSLLPYCSLRWCYRFKVHVLFSYVSIPLLFSSIVLKIQSSRFV